LVNHVLGTADFLGGEGELDEPECRSAAKQGGAGDSSEKDIAACDRDTRQK
jgi:hypothetical protein